MLHLNFVLAMISIIRIEAINPETSLSPWQASYTAAVKKTPYCFHLFLHHPDLEYAAMNDTILSD
jgi:hypothetical protein